MYFSDKSWKSFRNFLYRNTMKHYLSKPYLPQLYSPLIKRIDSPNETLYSNSVFIDCQQLRNIEHQEIMNNKVIMTD